MPQPALRELIGLAGLAAPEAGQIRVIGDDPVFPTPYRIAASGAHTGSWLSNRPSSI